MKTAARVITIVALLVLAYLVLDTLWWGVTNPSFDADSVRDWLVAALFAAVGLAALWVVWRLLRPLRAALAGFSAKPS